MTGKRNRSMAIHSQLTESEGIHQPFAWVWADKDSRDAEGVASADINKIGYQQDSGDIFQLLDLVPTWQRLGGKPAGLIYRVIIDADHSTADWFRLLIGGEDQLVIQSDTIWAFSALVVGTTSGATKSFAFKVEGAIENDGGTTALKGTPTTTVLDDSDDTSFDARAVADDSEDALAIEVQDSDGAGDTVRWAATVTVSEAHYAA
jgi:hypothetical protein